MNADRTRSLASLAVGAGLIALGALFLLGTVFRINVWGALWPFFIIVPGLLFFVGMFALGKPGAPLAVPGSIVTTVGLILFFQNLTGLWATWAYAWALIFPTAVGIGIAIAGLWGDDTSAVRVGTVMAGIGLAILLFFAFFFEVILNLNGLRSGLFGSIMIPVLIIGAGIVFLIFALRRR
ncbi:MAG: hypothetical protein MUC34_00360 [Anaerolineae bacterium]|jgi:hypothetical protein|nr:hypothetical protein [Anaerolineae bacterium]